MSINIRERMLAVDYGIAEILDDPEAWSDRPVPQWLQDHARVCLHKFPEVMHKLEILEHPEWTDSQVEAYRRDIKRGKKYRRIAKVAL